MATVKPVKREGGVNKQFGSTDTIPYNNILVGSTANTISAGDDQRFGTNLSISADQTTTLATAVDIIGLGMTVLANSTYRISGVIRLSCSGTGGIKFSATSPSGSSMFVFLIGLLTGSSSLTSAQLTSSGSLTSGSFNTLVGGTAVNISGTFTTGATPGNVQFQFASTTVGQTSTAIKSGTTLKIEKIS